jgi:hypothetical protein
VHLPAALVHKLQYHHNCSVKYGFGSDINWILRVLLDSCLEALLRNDGDLDAFQRIHTARYDDLSRCSAAV